MEFEKDTSYKEMIQEGMNFYRIESISDLINGKGMIPQSELHDGRFSAFMILHAFLTPEITDHFHLLKQDEFYLTAGYVVFDNTNRIVSDLPVIAATKQLIKTIKQPHHSYPIYADSITLLYNHSKDQYLLYNVIISDQQ